MKVSLAVLLTKVFLLWFFLRNLNRLSGLLYAYSDFGCVPGKAVRNNYNEVSFVFR